MDKTLIGTWNPDQSGHGSSVNEGGLNTQHISEIGASPSSGA